MERRRSRRRLALLVAALFFVGLVLAGLVFRSERRPTIRLSYPGASSLTNDLTPTIHGRTWSFERGANVTVTLSTGTGTGTLAQELTTQLDEDGRFSVTARRLDPGVYTAQVEVEPARAAARATFLVWELGRATSDATVAPGRLEGVSLVSAQERSPAGAVFDDPHDRIAVLSSATLNPTRWVSMGAWVRQRSSGGWQKVVAKPVTGEVAGQM